MKLTPREREVLKLTAWDCLSAKEIADRLYISVVTVRNHIQSIKMKEQVSKATELSKVYFIKYAKNIGATILIMLLSFNLFNQNSSDMRVRRARRSRRNEMEIYYEY